MTAASFALLSLIWTLPSPALAKKEKAPSEEPAAAAEPAEPAESTELSDTRIPAFDDTFNEVRGIQAQMEQARLQLTEARNGINTALGLSLSTALADSLKALNEQAEGRLSLVMKGSTPELSAADALPERTAEAVEAVNAAILSVWTAHQQMLSLAEPCQTLLTQMGGFRPQITPDLLISSGVEQTEMPRVSRLVKGNIAATSATQAELAALTAELEGFLSTVKDFGANLPQ